MEEERAVNVCQYCGRPTYLPFRCPYCGGLFCEDHRLPEAHSCPSLRQRRFVPHYSDVHAEYVVVRRRGRGFELFVYSLLIVSAVELLLFALKALRI